VIASNQKTKKFVNHWMCSQAHCGKCMEAICFE
jgi:hypothetical protein